jgi:ABC-type sugar transport system ATPase subunit
MVLVADRIRRNFGAVVAVADATIQLREGETLGLVGDNGAGKSTLLKILAGVLAPDGGRIVLDGHDVVLKGPRDALRAGIETVYQDLALVDTMSAAQNVFLGREVLHRSKFLRAFNLVDSRHMRERSREILDSLHVKVPSVRANVKQMSGGQRQSLAIARSVLWGRRIVILDEPTAALGVQESSQVLQLISRLKEHRVSVILVTHNMQHLVEVASRVTVMRLGRTVATRTVSETTTEEIVGLITGAIRPDEDGPASRTDPVPSGSEVATASPSTVT